MNYLEKVEIQKLLIEVQKERDLLMRMHHLVDTEPLNHTERVELASLEREMDARHSALLQAMASVAELIDSINGVIIDGSVPKIDQSIGFMGALRVKRSEITDTFDGDKTIYMHMNYGIGGSDLIECKACMKTRRPYPLVAGMGWLYSFDDQDGEQMYLYIEDDRPE